MLKHDHKPGGEAPTGADGALGQEQESEGILVTRRTALVAGGVGVGGLILGGGLAVGVPAADAALPTTTAPEQLRLEFGNDPETEMTVSWSAPGTVPMPAPTLAYSTRPISATNRLTRPRAGRPVNTFVSRVASSRALASATRCIGEVVASGVRR